MKKHYNPVHYFKRITDRKGYVFLMLSTFLGFQTINAQQVIVKHVDRWEIAANRSDYKYFGGDSLTGFDIAGKLNYAKSSNYNVRETQAYMIREERLYVYAKYSPDAFKARMGKNKLLSGIDREGNAINRTNDFKGTNASACNNTDFEDGNYTGWTGTVGWNGYSNGVLYQSKPAEKWTGSPAMNGNPPTLGTDAAENKCSWITLVTKGTDPYGKFPMLDVGGGTYAVRLGGEKANTGPQFGGCGNSSMDGSLTEDALGEEIDQSFPVTTSNALFTINYAVVLNDGGHPAGEQPFVLFQVLNSSGKLVSTCLQYYQETTKGKPPTGYSTSSSTNSSDGSAVYYLPWSKTTFNLSAYIGQTLTVQLLAVGCAAGEHFAYAYLDCSCGPVTLPIASSGCGSGTITAPAGAATYSWSGPCITGSKTGQTITATCSGVYSVAVNPTGAAGCSYTLSDTIIVPSAPTGVTAGANSPVCTGNTLNLTGTATNATSYNWTGPNGFNSTTQNPSITNVTSAAAGTYTLTAGNATGCGSLTSTITVTVNPTPTLNITAVSPSICPSSSTVINASGATNYTWTPSGTLSSSTGASVTATPGGTITYSVTGTNGSCSNTTPATVTVTVTPTPTITVSANPTICPGASAPLTAGGGVSYTWSPSTGLSNTSGDTVTASPGTTTTYSITGIDANGCTGTNTVTVIVNSSLVVTASAASPAVCIGGTGTVITAAGATNYTWSPTTGLSNTVYDTTTATPTSATTYSVTGVSGGCTATATVAINVNPTPTINIGLTGISAAICPGDSMGMTANGANTYVWIPATGLNCTNCPNPNAGPAATTIYTVTGTTAAGCSAIDTQTIFVYPVPVITLTTAHPSACGGDTVSLFASGVSSYSWSPAYNINTLVGPTVVVNPTVDTTYVVTGQGTGGCATKDFIKINVSPKPVVTITPAIPSVCSGKSTVLTASGATAYVWNTGAVTSTITISPNIAATYTVIGTVGAGCSDTATVTVAVNSSPTISVSVAAAAVCPGDSTSAFPVIAGGGVPPYTYKWTNGQTTDTATGLTIGSYSVIVTDSNACTSDTSTFTINLKKIAVTASSAAFGNTICYGTTDLLKGKGAASYLWLTGPTILNPTYDTTTVDPTTTTTYTVIGTAGGCIDTGSIVITVDSLPTGLAATASSISTCTGRIDTLRGSGATNYFWEPGALSGSPVIVTPGANTTYTLVGKTAAGCADSVTLAITVNTTPTVSISLSATDDTLCPGQPITLTANGVANNYLWSNGATTSTINVSPASNTVYTVVASNGACFDTSAAQPVYLYPVFTVTAVNDSGCIGKSSTVSVVATGGNPGYNYVWSNGMTGVNTITIITTATTTYSCTVTDKCGTSVTAPVVLTGSVPSSIGFIPTPKTIPGGQYISFVNTTTGALSYYWTFGNGATSTVQNPYEQYLDSGSYVVTLIATNAGCHDTLSDTVFVTEKIFIPNVFTPNGDGQNDVFHVTMTSMKEYHIEIYNRWGQRVFMTDSPETDWDGRSEGGIMESDGTYYYLITATDYDGKNYKFNGYLQLIGGSK